MQLTRKDDLNFFSNSRERLCQMDMKVYRKCPVCGSEKIRNIRKIEMELPKAFTLPNSYYIASCETCGMCYANTKASEKDYEQYYSNCNDYSGSCKTILVGESFGEKVESIVTELLGKEAMLVDIGCGQGDLLKRFKKLGYKELLGIDPSQESVDNLRLSDINAERGSIYNLPKECFQADSLFVSSVLEHLLYPKEAILALERNMKTGSYLFIDVPDYSEIGDKSTPIANEFNQEHINFFSKISLLNLFNGTHFKMVDMKEINIKTVGSTEHAALIILQKSESVVDKEFDYDTTSSKIESYLLQYDSRLSKISAQIEQFSLEQQEVVVWGAGAYAMSLLSNTALKDCNIVAFVDGNQMKIGRMFNNMTIESPSNITQYPHATILVCANIYAADIVKNINEMKLPNSVCIL